METKTISKNGARGNIRLLVFFTLFISIFNACDKKENMPTVIENFSVKQEGACFLMSWNETKGVNSYWVYCSKSASILNNVDYLTSNNPGTDFIFWPNTWDAHKEDCSMNNYEYLNSYEGLLYFVVYAESGHWGVEPNSNGPKSNIISYYYTSNNGSGGGDNTKPNTPTGVTASQNGSSVIVSWSSVSGATSYKVYRSNSAAGTYSLIGSPSNSSYTDNSPLDGYNYYKIAAVNSAGESAQSSPPAYVNYTSGGGGTFVAVISITGVPTSGTAGTPLTLTGAVNPSNATNRSITWSVVSAGTTGATISGSTLNTTATGTVSVRATVVNGATATTNYTETFNITITNGGGGFVAVTSITGVPTSGTAGTPLTLTGTVNPSNATNRTITWSVVSAGTTGATISGSTLYTTAAGTVSVRATIVNGTTSTTNYTQNFNITITSGGGSFVAVTSITGVPTSGTAGTPLTLTGTVNPSNATNRTIAWSIVSAGTTGATISGSTLYTTAAGTVSVRATIVNGATSTTNYTQNFNITIAAGFVPVTSITGVPTSGTAGTPLTLTGTVNPSNATYRTITWSIVSAGTTGATISGSTLNTTAAGTVSVRATILLGGTGMTNYTQNFNITIAAPALTLQSAHSIFLQRAGSQWASTFPISLFTWNSSTKTLTFKSATAKSYEETSGSLPRSFAGYYEMEVIFNTNSQISSIRTRLVFISAFGFTGLNPANPTVSNPYYFPWDTWNNSDIDTGITRVRMYENTNIGSIFVFGFGTFKRTK